MTPTYRVTFHNKPGECKPPVLGWSDSGILVGVKKKTVDEPLTLILRFDDWNRHGCVEIEAQYVSAVAEETP